MRKFQSSVLLFIAAIFCLLSTNTALAQTTLSATSLSFGSLAVGTISSSQSVTLTNTSGSSIAISSIAVTGADASSFSFANSCGASLAAGANCSIHGHFSPVAQGPLTAAVTITDSASNSPQTIALSGSGVASPPTLSATSLSFGSLAVGTISSSQSVTLTNSSSSSITISSIAVTGANASSFSFANSCGTSLAAGANCTIHGHFAPTVQGQFTAAVTITDTASNSPQTIALSGIGLVSAPTLTATSLSFGSQLYGTASASQSVTLTNNGTAPLAINSISVTGANASSFVFSNTCGTSVAVGGSCTIQGNLTPAATGALTATVNIVDDASNSPQNITLTGTGFIPAPTLSATSLSFGTFSVGTVSTSQSVTVTNTSTAPIAISSIAVTGANASSFDFVNTCGATLAGGANCSIHGHFAPVAQGSLVAAITITDNAVGSPQTVALSGTGTIPAPTLSATSLSFSNQTYGTTSASQSVTFTNNSSVAMSISSISVSGANASSFAFTNTCGSSVAAGANCTIQGTFTPTAVGAQSATVTIADNAVNSPQSISLTGTGIGATTVTLSASSLSFGNQMEGTVSTSQSVTLTNTGAAPLAISSISVTGANASSFSFANSCGTSLAAGANCQIHGHFAPTTIGPETAAITIVDDAVNSPQSIALTGTGAVVAPTLSATNLSFGNQVVGTVSSSQTVTLTNPSTSPLAITSITVTGANASAYGFANNCGTSLAAGASCTIHGHFAPATVGATTAAITIVDDAANSPQSIPLTGVGTGVTGVTLSTPSVTFANQAVGTTSASQSVTLTNTGAASMSIASIGVTGANASSFAFTNNCGTSLAAGAHCAIQGTFSPSALGALSATVTIVDNGDLSPQSFTLSGTGVNSAPTLSAGSIVYGNELFGQSTASQSVTLTNTSTLPLSFSSISVTGADASSFVIANSCGTSIAAGANCTIHGHFTPAALGALTATVTIADNAINSPQSITLTGTGYIPAPTLSASSLTFPSTAVGSTSAMQQVTLTNTGGTALSISSIAVTGTNASSFSITNNCGSNLPAGGSCAIQGSFAPTTTGTLTAAITITDDASTATSTVTLSGSAFNPPIASLSASSLAFGSFTVSSTSPSQSVTLTNTGGAALSITSISLTGVDASSFAFANSCGTSLAAGANCTIHGHFTPATTGGLSASVSIVDNAANSPQIIALTGTGLVPGGSTIFLGPSSIAFGAQVVNTASATQTLTLNNTTSNALTLTSVLFGGPFSLDTSATTTCPTGGGSLAGNSSCVIGVKFTPTAAGAANGQITVVDAASNSPQTATFTGTGVLPVTLSTGAVTFPNQTVNTTSAAQTVTLTNNQSTALNFSSLATVAPYAVATAGTTCMVGTPVAANGGACNISLTFAPTSPGAAAAQSLTIIDNATNSPQSVTLNGTGVASVSLSPTALAFGTVVVNEASVKSFTLTNNLATPLTISSFSGLTGGYSINAAGTNCPVSPLTVAAGGNCTIAVSLTATATGSQPGTLNINDNAPSSPQSVALSGNAIVPVVLSPSSLTFAAQYIGSPSTAQTVTLTNNQNIGLNISSITTGGANPSDFQVTTSCNTVPTPVPATTNCPINVVFKPTASGTRNATLTVADDAIGSPQTITLTGPGNAPVTVTPTSITTYTAPVGTTSAYQTITITNSSTAAVHISGFTLLGDFVQTSTTCPLAPAPLPVSNSCNLTVSFDPTIGGTRGGQVQINDDTPTTPQIVNLQGSGTSPLTLSTSSLSYSALLVGTVSPAQAITLTNHESKVETFTAATTGDFTVNSNCPSGVIAAQSSCLLYVNFTPTSTNPTTRNGTLTVTHSAAVGSPLIASLTGSATATNPPPAVSVVAPGAGAAGTVVNVAITGNGWTHFNASSTITFVQTDTPADACSLTVNNVTFVSANQLNASLTISASPIYGACNISVSSPLTGGGTETASLLAAFTIAEPSNLHDITVVNPAFGTQGQTLNVNLTAVGTHFMQGSTFANFGDGITVNSLTVTDGLDAQANITISNTTYIGYRTITMMTGGEFATSNSTAFQIGPNSATLVSVSPNTEPQNGVQPVTLTTTGTHFLQSATQVSIGGVLVGDVIVNSPTSATAQVAVSATAIGPQNVTVWTGGEIATLNNAFTITGATPALISVTPSTGVQGQQNENIVITGNAYTAFSQANIQAEFDGNITVNSITVNSPQQVTVNISISSVANVGSITANLISGPEGSATLFPFTFTVTPSNAAIVSVVPNSVPQGGQVTLNVTGINTIWNQPQTAAAFYPVPVPYPAVNEVTVNSPTSAQLAISVPTDCPPGTYGFYISTGGQIVSATINVYANTPTLTMNPANGLLPAVTAVNQFTVNFTGQFTHFGPTTLPVIAGEGVNLTSFHVVSPVSAWGTLTILGGVDGTPTATGSRLVTLTTGGEIVTTYFNVTQTPVGIYEVSPNNAPQNTTLNVEIVGLNTHFTSTGSTPTQVIFGGPQITVNSVTVNSPTDLIANITTSYLYGGVTTASPPGWQNVYVNTGAEQVIGGFNVDAPATPTVISVVPNSAAQGSTVNVTITGSATNWVNGTTDAILGQGVSVSNLVITSPTTATATIAVLPTAPVGGQSVIMVTGSEYDSGAGFSVTPDSALIQSVEPNFTCSQTDNFNVAGFGCNNGGAPTGVPVIAQLQTITLNIVGQGTHWLQGETQASFGPGVNVDQLTVNSPTTATVQITVLSTSPVGFAALTMTTDGEQPTLQQAIDIEEGSPLLLAISPSSAQEGATLNVAVLGRFTNWQQGVTSAAFNQDFPGDIVVNSINVIDSETLVANISVSPLSYVDYGYPCGHGITVTTGSEQVGGLPGNFCVSQGAEEITNVTPLDGVQGTTETVTITGSDTNFLPGVTQVSFGDPNFQVGEITVNSSTSLTVPVAITTSATTGFKTVTVTTYGQVAQQQYSFTVIPGVATLNEAIPNQLEQGVQSQVVRLIGQYSHFSGSSTAIFGAGITVNSIAYVSATEVDATISIDPLSYVGGRSVTVTTPNVSCAYAPPFAVANLAYNGCTPGVSTGTGSEIVTANVFSIIPGPAIISNVSPNTGNEGQEVVFNITGSATHWAQNFTQFYIAGGGSDLTINSVVINSPTSATVDLSISPTANPGARSIYMVTNGESLTDSGAFVVTGGVPVITYLSPNNALIGAGQVEVTINGLYTEWTQGGTTVTFGPGVTVTSYTVDDNTHITAVVNVASNAQAGYRTVFVQTGAQGLTSNFLVQAPPPPPTPYIWYESPSSGLPGQTFTIQFYGSNTNWQPGPGEACSQSGTTLTGFNASVTVNCFQVTSATSATANITISPTATASTSDLTFTTNSEVENAQFSVVIDQPRLSIVDPGSGMQGAQNLTVNIIGQYTTFDATTTFSFGPDITVNGPPTILGPTIATQSISINQLAPLGGSGVVATTTDTPGGPQVVGGASFSVSPSLALISAVTPNSALQGNTVTVEVTGQNTHWDGATTFSFGAGIVVSSTTVNSNTDATVTLVVPALAPEGPTSVSAETGGEIAYQNNGFVVLAGTPLLLSTGPGSVPQQGSVIFTILSQATNWTSASPPVVSYGPGITLTNTTVTGPTSLTVDGYVIPTTPVGYYNLTVTTGAETLGIQNAVYVSKGPAVINNLSPNVGGQAQNLPAVQINGTNTHWVQGTTQLTFPDVLINSFTVNSPTSITANITVNSTAPPGEISVTATTLGEIATGVNVFTISQTQPELLSVVPASGAQGLTSSSVTLTGDFTNWVQGTTTANFGAGITVNSVTVNSATSAVANITVSPTATLGPRTVSVTTGTQVVSVTNDYTVTVGPAAIVGPLAPASGAQGQSVNVAITGSQTHWVQGTTTAQFGGGIVVNTVTINSLTSATVNISIPNGTTLGSYNVSLTTGGEVASILNGFTVNSGTPQISVVNPPTGTQGTTFNVNLTGLYTHWVQGTSVASFGTGITVNTLTVSSSTTAVANITISTTATIASRNVTVTTSSEVATLTGGFSVLAGVPALTMASPGSAQAGTTANVVITGEFTTFQQGFSTVSFGSGVTVNVVTVNSTTQLTASISVASNASVGTRTITVTTNSQNVSLNNGFTVTAGTPVITQINPNVGNPGQTLNVTIYGQYTEWVQGTTTVSFGAGITINTVTVNSVTNLTANITIGAGTTPGPFTVQTTTGGEMESVPGGFTVQPASVPAPTLISLSPGANAGGMPINSSIIGVFSEPMNRTTITTSSVTLTLVNNPSGNIAISGTVTVDATGRVMTFTPTNLLPVNSQLFLNLTSSIQSATGTAFSNYGQYLYTEDSANITSPTVVTVNPPANATNVGTNVIPQLEFTTDMDQNSATGLTVSTGGNPVAGTWTWNSYPYGSPYWGPGTVAYFTPTAALTPGTVYTVSYNATVTDTAGNALVPGSFSFTTGAGADSTTNNVSAINFQNNQTNVGTNFIPAVQYQKPINPLDINSGTLQLYNSDSGKYVAATVTVAPNGLSATVTPTYPLLPQTYYRIYQAGGNYDMDGIYLNGGNWYFTTGAGTELTAPTVASISPANNATSVPLNADIVVHFSSAVSPSTGSSVITVTPSGGSAISGTATLASDLVTFTFVPSSALQAGKQFTVQVSGYADVIGNAGTTFSSTFTTSTSPTVINVSTGLNASGQLITTNNTNDANWTYVPVASLPGQGSEPLYAFSAGTNATGPAAPLQVIGTGDAGFYSGWPVNGPTADWIAINPNSVTGNTLGVYSTTFNIPGPTVPSNLCLVGSIGIDDNGELGVNGNAITGNISAIYNLAGLNVAIPAADLVVGSNTLSLGWGSTDNSDEAFRLNGTIETCGASYTGGLTVTSSTPSNGATGVATNTTVTINFNNPLDPATVNSSTLPILYGYNGTNQIAGTYQVSGNQVIFTPDSPFAINNLIYVTALNGPKDLAGDSAGGNYTTLFSFTTGGTAVAPPVPFQVAAFAPANNATNVGLRAPVTVTFNRSVDPYTINSSNNPDFELFAGDGQSPWCGGGSYNRSQDNTTLTFNCVPLLSGTTLTAEMSGGLTDWSGNALVPFTSQFTTSIYDSDTNGTVITSRPGYGASGIPVNEPITIYTNYPINAGTATNGFEVAQNNVAVPGTVAVLDGGYTLEFTPSTPWTPGAQIQWWTTGSLYETTYNTPITTTSGYFFVAGNTSTLTPTVQASSPTPYSQITPNVIFDVQFNTPLNPSTISTSTIYLWDNTASLLVSATYTEPQPNEVRMVPTSDLIAGHTVSLYINAGLQSSTSVPAAVNSWYYSSIVGPDDTTTPTIVSAVPFNGSTGVGVNVTPDIVTSKPMDPISVNSSTFQVTNGGTPLAGTFYFNNTDTRVGFVPNAPLPANTSLTMAINGILDHEGHPLTSTTSFTTGNGPDFTQPTVIWSSVNSNESVPTNSMIEVRFSESMDITTFANGQPGACGNFFIQDQLSGDGNPCIATTLTWSADQSTAYLVPSQPLAAGREYYFYINSGTDLAGNAMAGYSFYFYAELGSASTAPSVVAFNPLSSATGLGTNTIIEAQFNNPIDPTTIGAVTLTQGGTTIPTTPVVSSGNTVLQLVPAAPLAPNTAYTMHIAGVKDPAGNLVATVTNSFTTGATFDITPPAIATYDPEYNSIVGINVIPRIVFNKPLNPITVNSGSFRIYLADTQQYLPANVTLSANGLEVTITPQIPLLPNTRYEFAGGWNGGPQDEDGNYYDLPWLYFNTNSGTDITQPTVTISPVSGATAVPLNAQITATLSANIDPTTVTQSSVVVMQGGTPIAGTVTQPTSTELVFTPAGALAASTTYTVQVTGITDANGNGVAANSSSFTTGTLAATGGLTFSGSTITSGSNVTNNVMPITISFSQVLNPATVFNGNLLVTNSQNTNWGIAGTWTINPSNGTQVTFTPSNPYPPNATIWVYITTALTDVAGDSYSSTAWPLNFTTNGDNPDTTPLTVLSVNPASGATNVRPDTPVSVTFNKGINPYSIYNNSNNALLFAGQGLEDRGSVTLSADNRTMTFSSGVLATNAAYTIDLPAGGIVDPSGNALATTFTSTFTTGGNPASGNGTVQSTEPGNVSGVPTDSILTLFMNRQVNTSTVPGQLSVTVNGSVYAGTLQTVADGYEIQYTPTVPFPNGATVQWFLSGSVLDVYGDAFNGTSGYFYTVAAVNTATAQPTVVAVSPDSYSSTVPINSKIDIEFNLPIDPTTVNTSNVYFNTGTAATVSVLASPNNNIIHIVPNASLAPGSYYVCVNGNVKGTNGVATSGSCWTINNITVPATATSPDTTAGTVTIGPPNSSVNVGTNAYIRLWLSKPVDITSVNSTTVAVTAGGNAIPGTWGYNYSNSDVREINFSPVNPLPPSTTITVTVNGLLDYAGNTFTAATSNFTTAALPDYTTPSVTLDFGGNTQGVATNASFTCLYSEPMDPGSINPLNTYIYSYTSNATIPFTYTWAADLMAVTMKPTTTLFANSEYVYYCQNGINLTGNGQSNSNSYFFTGNGPSTAGPTLLYANPPSGTTNVPLNSNTGPWNSTSLMLLFSEPVTTDSLANITFTPQGGSAEPIAVNPEDGNFIAVVQLPWALVSNTTYTFNVAGVTDINGNPASGTTTSSFTTGSAFDWNSNITAVATPANGTTVTGISPSITLTFGELMNPVLITSTQIYLRTHNTQTTVPSTLAISTVGGVTVVTVTPTSPLAESTIYDLVYWPYNWYLYDVAGNSDGNYGVETTFTTGTVSAVNGLCGSANTQSFSSAPTANLCSAGTASTVTNPGSWTWTCNGQNGGTNASCSATVTGTPACSAQLSSLQGLWPGTDNANDYSPNGYNGTLENGVTYSLGEVGDAFNLEGNTSSSTNQYVLIGEPVPTNLQIQNAITLSAWIYPTAIPTNYGSGAMGMIAGSQIDGVYGGATIFFDGRVNPDNNPNNVPAGHIQFNLGNGSNWALQDTETQVPLNQWTLITATATAGGSGQVYYNGVLQPSNSGNNPTTWSGVVSYPSNDWFAIGQEVNEDRPFTGLINDVQVYNAALTPAQITAIYNAGSGGVCK